MKNQDRIDDPGSGVDMAGILPPGPIDRTLIRFTLELTPSQRLEYAKAVAESLGALLDAEEAHHDELLAKGRTQSGE